MHADVAASIQRGDGDRAHAAMVAIMNRTMDETKHLWEIQTQSSTPA
jgi:DNA-binding GntR family transcriptional regulator